MEARLMLVAIVVAGRFIGRRFHGPRAGRQRLGAGMIAVGFVLAADLAVGIALRGMSPAEVFTDRDPVSGSVYYGLLGLCAVMPWLFGRRGHLVTSGGNAAN